MYHSSLSLNEPVPKPRRRGSWDRRPRSWRLLGAVAGEVAADHLGVGVGSPPSCGGRRRCRWRSASRRTPCPTRWRRRTPSGRRRRSPASLSTLSEVDILVRSPVVSKAKASHWPIWSGSNIRPSLEATTSKPCSLPMSVRTRSASASFVAILSGDDRVGEARALGEEQDLLARGPAGGGEHPPEGGGPEQRGPGGEHQATAVERHGALLLGESRDRAETLAERGAGPGCILTVTSRRSTKKPRRPRWVGSISFAKTFAYRKMRDQSGPPKPTLRPAGLISDRPADSDRAAFEGSTRPGLLIESRAEGEPRDGPDGPAVGSSPRSRSCPKLKLDARRGPASNFVAVRSCRGDPGRPTRPQSLPRGDRPVRYSLERKVMLWYAAVAAISLALGVVAIQSVTRSADVEGWVDHTHVVLRGLRPDRCR